MLAHSVAQSPAKSQTTDAKVAVVVGAGPAGIATAALLARRGWRCEVFERRDELNAPVKTLRGYPMSLNARTFRTLSMAGLDVPSVNKSSGATPREGWVVNGKKVSVASRSATSNPEDCQFLVDRVAFNQELYLVAHSCHDEYEKQGGSIRWHWGQALQSVDFDTRTAVFASSKQLVNGSNGQSTVTTSAEYDLLIGCDGYNSVVRREMMSKLSGFKSETVADSISTYKTFHELPITAAVETALPEISKHAPGQFLYVFRRANQPGASMALWKQRDGSVSGMIVDTGEIKDVPDLRHVIQELFSDLPGLNEWIDPIIKAVGPESKQQPASFSRIIHNSQFHGPSCVLLGDSAHAVTSNLGSGCNLALESVRVFINTLDKVGLEKAPEVFTKERMADARAFQTLEYTQLLTNLANNNQKQIIRGVERSSTPLERIYGKLVMQLSSLPMMVLNKLFPSKFPYPMMLSYVLTSADVPFTQGLRAMQASAGVVVMMAVAVLGALATLMGMGIKAVMA